MSADEIVIRDPRPKPPPIATAAQLPPELTALPRWISWRYEWKDSTWAKMPESPATGVSKDWPNASVSFDVARAGAERLGADGLGFNPIAADRLIFLDFDDCLQNGVLDPEVAMWLKHFPGYKEVTPSGTGIRVVVKGWVPRNVTNHVLPGSQMGSSVELYAGGSAHFVTITGQSWGEPHFEIHDGQVGINKLLEYIAFDPGSEEASGETTEAQAVAYFERNCNVAESLRHGRYVFLVRVCWWLGRVLGAKPKNPVLTFENIKSQLEAAISKTGWTELRHIEGQLTAGQRKPVKLVNAEDKYKEFLEWLDDMLEDKTKPCPSLAEMAKLCASMPVEDFAPRRRAIFARLKVRSGDLEAAMGKARKEAAKEAAANFNHSAITADDVKALVDDLLDSDPKEYQKKQAEHLIWTFLKAHSTVYCCDGQGQLLMNDGDGVPIDVSPDSQSFNKLLISFGVHPGSPSRHRIGSFVETQCFHEGIQTTTRLAFHFDRKTFTAYAASRHGWMVKITRFGLEEVPNGTDDVLFVYPPSCTPLLTKPLEEVGGELGTEGDFPKSDICVHALFVDGFLVRNLFGGTNFEIRSMSEKQVRILIMSYLLFLMAPGVVAERALLQALGPSSSGKTFLLELIGFVLCGPKFSPRSLPTDITEFEIQVINSAFLVYDNVSKISADIRDRFCASVTGLEIVRRVLFTDKREMREMSKATISLSAIEAPLPELEHQNRTITINFGEREAGSFIAKEELLRVVAQNRDDIILNLMRRMTLALEALYEQRDFVPKVGVRLASIGTFILRIARHEGWEEKGTELLTAWLAEQTGYSMVEDDVSTAMTRWIGSANWVPGVELTASMLNDKLCDAMGFGEKKYIANRKDLSWRGNHLMLAKTIARNLKVYVQRFGLERAKSTLSNSRGNHTYKFNPSIELLDGIKSEAKYERDNTPRDPDGNLPF